MPRPRFDKLDPERKIAILTVASEEFAEHGFEAASYNRIIERSGLSKGAIYYYFDDKEDLYATVLKDALQRLILDTTDLSAASDAETFWKELEAGSKRSLHAFKKDPHAIGLARSLVKALARGSAGGVIAELKMFARSWMTSFLHLGQSLGAVRTDVPEGLLISILISLEEGIDLWLGETIAEMSAAELDETAAILTDLYRRVTAPHAAPRKSKPATRSRSTSRR